MIAKHIAMKSLKKSSYAELLEYLLDNQEKNERVGKVLVTNCHNDDCGAAILEIINTQGQNKRAASDKTYHLIVSFREGEQPDDQVLKEIEARICAGLGFGEHQRISVVHHDTDHLHVHIAINKIHPIRYTIHNPHNDHKLLGPLCEKLEREYGLEQDNHQVSKHGVENRVDDMEHHAGVESLLGWIKRECHGQMQEAKSWPELHQVMRTNGLLLHERANGLVISSDDGTRVKASSVDRAFSKAKLEARFGSFQEADIHANGAKRTKAYRCSPMKSKADTVELYARYKQEQQDATGRRTTEWAMARDRQKRHIETAKRAGRLKRGAIKLLENTRTTKRMLFTMSSAKLRGEIESINKQYFKDRQAISAKYKRLTWADWLRVQAVASDNVALAALRARSSRTQTTGDSLSGKKSTLWAETHLPADSITKQGTIIYCVGATVVRDRGDKLSISRGANDQLGLQHALQLAIDRFGKNLSVHGTTEFKEQVARAAAVAKLVVTFDDAALELRRQALLNQTKPKEKEHDQVARSHQQRHRRIGPERPGAAATSPVSTAKPNIGKLGLCPPPEGKNGLRGLSQLGVVRIASRSEVLLPGDVPGHVEHQGATAHHRVRRPVPGAELSGPLSAAQKYVFEREQERADLFDIPKFARYDGFHGQANFAGIRRVDGHNLALLEHSGEIQVLPIDDATAKRLKGAKLGSAVIVTSKGLIKAKGRSR